MLAAPDGENEEETKDEQPEGIHREFAPSNSQLSYYEFRVAFS